MSPKRTFIDVAIGDAAPQRIMFELDADRVPKTVENFRALCTGEKGMSEEAGAMMQYKGSIFHRVIDSFMLQAGDFTRHDGKGGYSIYGPSFTDEDLSVPLDQAGLLAMANRGPDTNSSQWFITLDDCSHLNEKHVVFGKVVKGMDVVETIAKVATDAQDKPLVDVTIVHAGELVKKSTLAESSSTLPVSRDRRRLSSGSDSDSSSSEQERRKRRREKKSRRKDEKRSSRRRHRDDSDDDDEKKKMGKKDKLNSLVQGYVREETEEELDARLEREENERLEAAKREKMESLKRQIEEEKRQQANGGVIYKGRGAMRYLDPETTRDRLGYSGRPYPPAPRGRPGRGQELYDRLSARSPPPAPRFRDHHHESGRGGVDGDWRAARRNVISSGGPRRETRRSKSPMGFERGTMQDRDDARPIQRSPSPVMRRGERRGSEESMDLDVDV